MAGTSTRTLSNLPLTTQKVDSATRTLQYFNEYGNSGFEFSATDVDAAAGFLQGKGFSEQASIVTSAILLQQAKRDNVPVYELLDTLKGLETLQLSALVGRILNDNRSPTSALGFKISSELTEYQKRNIVA